ncbi:MAG: transcriptional repressor [Anaerolineae bacterium]|nr:transcriptional repressor [Anaerolineae bacterium]MBT7071339.1 transcriptional repressor [Anaerolineae bacterium]MBT7324141.1 transcriptional repressor [Anaerolineae bacterium]
MSAKKWLKELRAQGYRLTDARRAVVETVAQSPRALTPSEVYDLARERYPTLGLVTVYRTLEKLEELHLAQRVHQDDGCNAYLAHAEGHQHLLICEKCKKAVYFEGDDLDDFFTEVGKKHNFAVKDHWLQLFGTCEDCKYG